MPTRAQIADRLTELLGPGNVETEEAELRRSSIDRYRKYQDIHQVYVLPTPAAVAYANSTADVAAVLGYANANRINVVPRTGRSATEGGLETALPDSIVLDGSRMNQIVSIDAENMQVSVQCGVCLQDLEDLLRARGLTTGHSPQSKPLAQLGGLTATRSIGQLSTLYGGSRTWWSAWRRCCPTAGSAGSRTCPAAPRGQTSAISRSATRELCVSSPR